MNFQSAYLVAPTLGIVKSTKRQEWVQGRSLHALLIKVLFIIEQNQHIFHYKNYSTLKFHL